MSDKILFRCDAGHKSQLGTGHLMRSITLAKILIKNYKIKKNNILFLIKTKKKFSPAKRIIKFEKLNYKSIDENIKDYSSKEFEEISKNKFKIIIFDRLGKIKLKFIKKIKKKNQKIICFDDSSKNRFLCDLSFNPLIFKTEYIKSNHFSGHKYNILPSLEFKKKIKKISKINKIFISFGGFDKNNYNKLIYNKIKNENKFQLVNSKLKNKSKFQNKQNFFEKMNSSDLVICSGGLTMFDAINLNKITIVIDQYKHQLTNINRLRKKVLINYFNKKEANKLILLINKINKKNILKNLQKKIIGYKKTQRHMQTIKKIYKLYAA